MTLINKEPKAELKGCVFMPMNYLEEDQDEPIIPPGSRGPGIDEPMIGAKLSRENPPVRMPVRVLSPGARSAFWQMQPQSAANRPSIGHMIVGAGQEQASPLGGAFALRRVGMRPPQQAATSRTGLLGGPRVQRLGIGHRILGIPGQPQSAPNLKPKDFGSRLPSKSGVLPKPVQSRSGYGSFFSSFVPAGANGSDQNATAGADNRIGAEARELSKPSGRERRSSFTGTRSRFGGPAFSAKPTEARQNQAPSEPVNQLGGQFVDPRSQAADTLKSMAEFLKWRNQNFRSYGGGKWEAPNGRLYTDEQLRALYPMEQQQAAGAQRRREQERYASSQPRGRTVTITYTDGTKERRTGNYPQRDNNPGDLNSGEFSNMHGAVGRDGPFAIFPSAEAGWAAMDTKLKSDDYWNLTIDQAIYNWAPPKNAKGQIINDTAGYQRKVRTALGVADDTKISALTPDQFEKLKQAIAKIEGFYETRPGKKVDIVVAVPDKPSVIQRK